MLKRKGVPHNVLNAKQHKSEAEIVARAGQKGAVTIATNMAGRGTDIKLGGNKDFIEEGKSNDIEAVSYTHLRDHETPEHVVLRDMV